MVWLCLLIPVFTLIILAVFAHHRIHPIEYVAQFTIPSLLILAGWFIGTESQIQDEEYLGGWIVSATYEEPWNEYITAICTREIRNSDGSTSTEYYDCSYVQYHSDKWTFLDSMGYTTYINQHDYQYLVNKFSNQAKTGHHKGYTQSGDIYSTFYPGTNAALEPVTRIHSYYNRVQNSSNVMNFQEVSVKEAKERGLHFYPSTNNNCWHIQPILGGGTVTEQNEFARLNAVYGASKQICIWVLIYENKDRYIVQDQINFWKNGNKNEFILCLGLKDGKLVWSDVFTWSDSDSLRLATRDYLITYHNKPVDLVKVAKWLEPNIVSDWKRKEFAEFNYLPVELSSTVTMIIFVLTVVSSVVCAIIFIYNDLDVYDVLT